MNLINNEKALISHDAKVMLKLDWQQVFIKIYPSQNDSSVFNEQNSNIIHVDFQSRPMFQRQIVIIPILPM